MIDLIILRMEGEQVWDWLNLREREQNFEESKGEIISGRKAVRNLLGSWGGRAVVDFSIFTFIHIYWLGLCCNLISLFCGRFKYVLMRIWVSNEHLIFIFVNCPS